MAQRIEIGGEEGQGNALAEVALALAIALFAIMVLALVSMGTDRPAGAEAKGASVVPPLNIVPPAAVSPARGQAIAKVSPDNLVILVGERFFDARLRPVDPTGLADKPELVLAVPAETPMTRILAARRRLANDTLTVTTLDAGWREALKETSR